MCVKLVLYMLQPDTEMTHALIETTAKYVASNGPQMESLIKTRQAGSTKFDFLRAEDKLHPYYLHMVQLMKSGKYNPNEKMKSKICCIHLNTLQKVTIII